QVEEAIRNVDFGRHMARGRVAMAQSRWQDAVTAFRTFHESPIGGGPVNGLFELAQAHDAAGNADSALALYGRVADTPRFYPDNGPALKRLGELYEQRGDREKAIEYYGRLVDLWKNADPELQPVVNQVKQRMARLVGER
ncbi:MAG TPA: tetratricopeptide repeat protein, partial [Gemmatimonadales bacterium]|nr:tetratricopeptide repeat protein [Gemmatimonadales bacterium]